MTYSESSALMQDIEFRNRIKVAAMKYADVILNRPTDTPGINGQRNWAQACVRQPDATAQGLQPAVVMDGAVQEAGAAITDGALQVSVETQINRSF